MTETVALVTIAAELGVDADRLAAELGEHVSRDWIGLRAIPVDVAKRYIADTHAAANARQDARDAQRALARARHRESITATRARLAARGRRDAAMLSNDGSLPALAVMMASDVESKLDARGQREARLRRGESFGESYGPQGR